MRLTLLSNGHREPMPLADAIGLCEFYEFTGRTIPRAKWVDEIRERIGQARQDASIEGLL